MKGGKKHMENLEGAKRTPQGEMEINEGRDTELTAEQREQLGIDSELDEMIKAAEIEKKKKKSKIE